MIDVYRPVRSHSFPFFVTSVTNHSSLMTMWSWKSWKKIWKKRNYIFFMYKGNLLYLFMLLFLSVGVRWCVSVTTIENCFFLRYELSTSYRHRLLERFRPQVFLPGSWHSMSPQSSFSMLVWGSLETIYPTSPSFFHQSLKKTLYTTTLIVSVSRFPSFGPWTNPYLSK